MHKSALKPGNDDEQPPVTGRDVHPGEDGPPSPRHRRTAGFTFPRKAAPQRIPLTDRIADDMRFLKTWAENPLSTAAVTPSGGMLSRLMARFVEAERDGPVVELGPGTGVVTRAMLDRGIEESRLVLIEWNGAFCDLLRERFPRATVIRGDAFALGAVLQDADDHSLATVISGLPLFIKPVTARERLLDDALRLMAPGAPFIQFSYALVPAVPNKPRRYAIARSSWVLANLPPARVWTYRAML